VSDFAIRGLGRTSILARIPLSVYILTKDSRVGYYAFSGPFFGPGMHDVNVGAFKCQVVSKRMLNTSSCKQRHTMALDAIFQSLCLSCTLYLTWNGVAFISDWRAVVRLMIILFHSCLTSFELLFNFRTYFLIYDFLGCKTRMFYCLRGQRNT